MSLSLKELKIQEMLLDIAGRSIPSSLSVDATSSRRRDELNVPSPRTPPGTPYGTPCQPSYLDLWNF